ncbi:DUF6307 family protein [Amycolatopsis anabasis]|uniref:DUF6307 family protein n=1 Tax=Amycolatopsis anabasis TaxID=1840409 RepID=UPI003CCE3F0E
MADIIEFVPRYDRRVKLVREILHEGATLTHQESSTLAIRILSILDTFPGGNPSRPGRCHRSRTNGVVRYLAGMNNNSAPPRSPTSMEVPSPARPVPSPGS